MASTQGTSTGSRKMEIPLQACTLKSRALKDHLKNHLNQSLGVTVEESTVASKAQVELAQTLLEATKMAMEMMKRQAEKQSTQTTSKDASNVYYKGCSDMLQLQ